jgi:hypothetical protein
MKNLFYILILLVNVVGFLLMLPVFLSGSNADLSDKEVFNGKLLYVLVLGAFISIGSILLFFSFKRFLKFAFKEFIKVVLVEFVVLVLVFLMFYFYLFG